MSLILEMLGSVEHEGTATIKLQKEGICSAFTITAFTSSCQAKLGSLCSGPPEHHSLQPPHGVEDCTVFTYFHLHVVTLSPTSPLLFSSFPVWHCVSHALALRCHGEIFVKLEAGTYAGSRAWILASRFCVIVSCVPYRRRLECVDKSMWNEIGFGRCPRNFF